MEFPDLAAFREASGLTQADLAERLGISQGHLSKIEAGRHRPGIHLRERLRRLTEADSDVARIDEIQAAADRSPEFRALLAAALRLMHRNANA